MLVQAVSYADLAGMIPLYANKDVSERVGYILLVIVGRSLLEVLTFSVVAALWLETVGKTVNRSLQSALMSCAAILVSTSLLQAFDMLNSEEELVWIYKLHSLVEAICWLLHCLVALVCCILTTRRILSLSTFPQFENSERVKILAKSLLPMLLCATCYGVRAGCLFAFELESRTPTYARESLAWWVGFTWIPTLIPSLMLLYSTRKRDVLPDLGSASTPLLLSPPGPPAEAFISFQRLNPEALLSPFRSSRVSAEPEEPVEEITFEAAAVDGVEVNEEVAAEQVDEESRS